MAVDGVKNNKSNVFGWTLGGVGTGAALGGGLGYLTTKIAKDGVPTDEFVHTVTKEHFINQTNNDSVIKEAGLDIQLDKIKELQRKENLTQEELKAFLEKNKNIFKENLEAFNKNPGEVTSKFSKILQKYNKNFDYVKEQLTKYYDISTKKFNISNMDTYFSTLVKNTEKAFKIGNAMKYGVIAGITCGFTGLIIGLSKKNNA